jgi:hypothetical protein
MQLSYEVKMDERLFIITISGRFDLGEVDKELSLYAGRNLELADYSRLLDIRQAELDHLSSDDAKAYGAVLHLPKPSNIAILVSNDVQRRFAAAFIAGRYLNGIYAPCRVFEQLDEALSWLEELPRAHVAP